jgi:hypothetical protein
MAQTRPIYMPGLNEHYELVENGPSDPNQPMPVRLDRAQPINELLALEYRRIRKGSFEEFHAITRDAVYPYLEKIGVRPIGQWHVLYLPNSSGVESDEYDELYTFARYANYDHYKIVWENAVILGGNGPDYQVMLEAFGTLNALTQEASVEFMRGPLFGSPPQFAPPHDEVYDDRQF